MSDTEEEQDEQEKQEKREKQEEQNSPFPWGTMFSALGGAVIGAAATYFLANEEGQMQEQTSSNNFYRSGR